MVVELGAVTVAHNRRVWWAEKKPSTALSAANGVVLAVRLAGAIQSASSEGHSVRTHFGSRLEGAGVTKPDPAI